ncbi:MAG: trypsin-like peptidase domain-containing protein [Tepidisphaeraceae bacterium]|jgi:serine protease Do
MKLMRSGFGVAVLSLSAIAAGYFGGRPILERVEFARAEADVQSTRDQLSTVEDLSTVFRHIGKVVEPSVVQIKVHKTIKESRSRIPDNDELRRFLHEHGFGDVPNFDDGSGNDQGLDETGTGSGVIMDAENGHGYVLTNNHVAGDASRMEITLSDGRKITGSDVKLLGADPKSDLAVVQINADRLIPAKWGNSDDLEKGDWVMAFGSPFGYVGSMTHGIVSALNRNEILQTQDYENFIQVDAPINPGNSGGPLVNVHGEVIGINTAIATVSGGFQGIGFAIPSNQAKEVYTALKSHGKVVRGWLGISIKSVSDEPDVAKYLGYQGSGGVLVVETFPNFPASGKLHHGDIITAINGQPLTDVQQLRNTIADMAPNTSITLHVFRNQKELDVQITLGDQPEDIAAILGHGENGENPGPANEEAQSPAALGMTLKTLDAQTAQSLGLGDVRSGAVITGVERNSVAALAGLREGDVITEVGRTPVHNAAEAVDALKKVDLSKGVPLYIASKEGSQFVFLKSNEAQK